MTLITGFTCPPTIYFKFNTKCDKCYYKLRQLFLLQSAMVCYYKMRQLFITKCDKCYYKVRQVLQSETILLQSATIITKCDSTHETSRPADRRSSNWANQGAVSLIEPLCKIVIMERRQDKCLRWGCGILLEKESLWKNPHYTTPIHSKPEEK